MHLIEIITFCVRFFPFYKRFYKELQLHGKPGEGWVENREVVLINQRFQFRRNKIIIRNVLQIRKNL